MHLISAGGELSTKGSCQNGMLTPIMPFWTRALFCNLYAYWLVCVFFPLYVTIGCSRTDGLFYLAVQSSSEE